jgi:hypothetical protein
MDLTDEQWGEFYGLSPDEDGDFVIKIEDWKPDFTKWVAVLSCEDGGQWCLAPKPFWEANRYVPDHCLSFKVLGFREVKEHTIESDSNEPDMVNEKQVLKDLGFEVLDGGWYFEDRK